jgi:uncharacterized protein (DUF3084 family)
MTVQSKKELIVVLGMHRSGTSAITRALQILDVDLGDNLMPPAKGNNERGFFEDIDINALNVELLATLDNDWHFLESISENDVKRLKADGYLNKAAKLLGLKTDNYRLFGFKDPRTAKLLPFWQEVFKYLCLNVNYVLAIRNPRSVVNSLAKRDTMDFEKGYLLWLSYVMPSLTNTTSKERVIVDYDNLVDAPAFEIKRIANKLQLPVNSEKLSVYIEGFLDNKLRNEVYNLTDLIDDEKCPQLVSEVYSILRKESKINADDISLLGEDEVVKWALEFGCLDTYFIYIDKLLSQLSSEEATITTLLSNQEICDNKIVELNECVLTKDITVDAVKQELLHRKLNISQFSHKLDNIETSISELNQELVGRETSISELNRELIGRETSISELNQELVDRELSISELNQELVDRESSISVLNQGLVDRESSISVLNQELVDRESSISVLNQGLVDRESSINVLNQELVDRESSINVLNQGLVDRESSISVLNQELVDRESSISVLNQELVDRESSISELNQELVDRESSISGLNQELVDRESSISELNQELFDRESSISELNQELVDRESSINVLNQELFDRESSISELNQELVDRESSISELNQELVDRESSISDFHQNEVTMNRELIELDKEIKIKSLKEIEQNVHAKELNLTIQNIKNSFSWRITAPLRGTASIIKFLLNR